MLLPVPLPGGDVRDRLLTESHISSILSDSTCVTCVSSTNHLLGSTYWCNRVHRRPSSQVNSDHLLPYFCQFSGDLYQSGRKCRSSDERTTYNSGRSGYLRRTENQGKHKHTAAQHRYTLYTRAKNVQFCALWVQWWKQAYYRGLFKITWTLLWNYTNRCALGIAQKSCFTPDLRIFQNRKFRKST